MRFFCFTFLAFFLPLTAQAQSVTLSAGVDYSSGDYGAEENTDILFVPLGARITFGNFAVRLSVPYLSIDGSGDVIPADGNAIVTDRCARIQFTRPVLFERFCQSPEGATETVDNGNASGLGDVVAALSYTVPAELSGDFGLTFEGRIKLPTADVDTGLGTGETDAAFSIDAAWYGAEVIPFVTLGYRFFGDPTFTDDLGDFTVDLQNGFTASTGLTIPIGSKSTFTIAYDYLQTSVAGVQDVHELYGAVQVPLVNNWSVSAYSVAGLTDASPDFAVGLSLRWRFSG